MTIAVFDSPRFALGKYKMDHQKEADSLCRRWALWTMWRGSSQDWASGLSLKRGGTPDPCADLPLFAAARYVEATYQFWAIRPILLWVYALGRPIEDYVFRPPGRSLADAIAVHGTLLDKDELSGRERQAARLYLEWFLKELSHRLEVEPAPAIDARLAPHAAALEKLSRTATMQVKLTYEADRAIQSRRYEEASAMMGLWLGISRAVKESKGQEESVVKAEEWFRRRRVPKAVKA